VLRATVGAACDRGATCDRGCCMRSWVLRATVVLCVTIGATCDMGAFERNKCGRTHFGRIFTLSPLSCPLLTMFVVVTCTTQNTKNYTKY
jgi:hypothetical protein